MIERNKVAFYIKALGLIVMIISCREASNLLDSNIANILRVLGSTLMCIGMILEKKISK